MNDHAKRTHALEEKARQDERSAAIDAHNAELREAHEAEETNRRAEQHAAIADNLAKSSPLDTFDTSIPGWRSRKTSRLDGQGVTDPVSRLDLPDDQRESTTRR